MSFAPAHSFLSDGTRRSRGFTLVELMIAIGLSVVVIVATMGVMISSHRATQLEEETSYVQQSARSVLDFIMSDLERAGLGLPHPDDVTDEARMAFQATSENRGGNTLGQNDRLVFAASEGGVAFVELNAAMVVSAGGTAFLQVNKASLGPFNVGDRVVLYNLDRQYLTEGYLQSMNLSSGQISIAPLVMDVGLTSVTLENNTIVMQYPHFIIYAVAADANGQMALYRCIRDDANASCPDITIGDDIISDTVEGFHVTVMTEEPLPAANQWITDFNWVDINDRKRIRALKIDVLVRGFGFHDDYEDTNTYVLGDWTFQPNSSGTNSQHYVRVQMSGAVRMQNLM